MHLQPQSSYLEQRVERLPSAYIRQMAAEKFLIPGINLNLIDTIGQGEAGTQFLRRQCGLLFQSYG